MVKLGASFADESQRQPASGGRRCPSVGLREQIGCRFGIRRFHTMGFKKPPKPLHFGFNFQTQNYSFLAENEGSEKVLMVLNLTLILLKRRHRIIAPSPIMA
jgi:hypothetical protein